MKDKIRAMGRSLQTASKTITGSWEKLLFQGSVMTGARDGVWIKNQSATLAVYGYIANSSEADALVGTLTADDRLFNIPIDDYVLIHLTEDEELLVCNSSGGVTTSTIAAREFQT